MPYALGDSLSRVHGADKYKGAQKRAFIHAFNQCYEKTGHEESRCYRIAHTAAKQAGGNGKADA